jgi:hypothetical protein
LDRGTDEAAIETESAASLHRQISKVDMTRDGNADRLWTETATENQYALHCKRVPTGIGIHISGVWHGKCHQCGTGARLGRQWTGNGMPSLFASWIIAGSLEKSNWVRFSACPLLRIWDLKELATFVSENERRTT